LEQAISGKDFENARISAHAMKSQLRMMGASKCLALAEHIEQCCLKQSGLEDLSQVTAALESEYNLAAKELREKLPGYF
jgi:HPt (histidine-containing phosphotransfer) domain-containing protein